MAIRAVSFNDGAFSQNGDSAPVGNITQNDSNRFAPNTVFSLPINKEHNAFLIRKSSNNEEKRGENNFFLNQPENQINPFEDMSASPSKPLVLSSQTKFGMNTENRMDKSKDSNPFMRAAEYTFTPIRRIESAPDEIKKGNLVPALGAIGLTAINFPEDWRDIKTAAHQVSSFVKGEKYEGAYDYLKCQHEFSFFRGTLLGWMVDIKKHPKMAKFLLNLDKSLWQTTFGEKILDFLHVDIEGFKEVKRYNKETKVWELAKDINDKQRFATEFKGKWFGEITARGLSRTTLIGTGIFALMELYNIAKASTKDDKIGDKAKNGAKQIVKSSINFASVTAGIGYGGAIGAKYGRGFGSLVGMGIGAVIGNEISNKIQNVTN